MQKNHRRIPHFLRNDMGLGKIAMREDEWRQELCKFHKHKKLPKNMKKILAKYCKLLYNDLRCELIAMKREVATQHYRVGFPWSECQVMIPGDKSLYRTKYFCESRKRVVSAIREAEKSGVKLCA